MLIRASCAVAPRSAPLVRRTRPHTATGAAFAHFRSTNRSSVMAYNRRSQHITQGVARAPNRSMFYALGYKKDDFDKPMIGVANGHSTITPCNAGLQKLADAAVAAVIEAGANA